MNNNEVTIDIGHGGSDSGAVYGKDYEKNWNLDTGLSCIAELERHNVKVNATRTTDKALSINERCAFANKTNSQYFISIHHNAGKGDRGEVIHSLANGTGKELAEKVAKELGTLGQTSVKVYNRATSSGRDYYGVIRGTRMKAIIVEVCFIDNTADRQIADTLEERKKNGIAIAHGILKQLGIAIKPIADSNDTNVTKPTSKFKNGDYSSKKAKVTANVLNVRYDRGTQHNIIGKLKKGDIVKLNYCLNGWVSIEGHKGNKGLGYVHTDYLELI